MHPNSTNTTILIMSQKPPENEFRRLFKYDSEDIRIRTYKSKKPQDEISSCGFN